MSAKTDAERKREERTRLREAGYRPISAWVHPEDYPKVLAFLARLRRKRS